jgi:NAD(P)-dependent dehydrogenase (short-subunit alcohol dehydrogenase family)
MTMPRPGFLDGLFGLAGEVALVTGAGSGIGRAVAETLAGAGAFSLCADLNLDAAKTTATAIREAGGEAEAFPVDVADEASVLALFETLDERFARLDVLVNNAGIFPKYDFLSIDGPAWDKVQNVNLRGAYFCMREALKRMKARSGGRIVNLSSSATLNPVIYDNSHYGASKAGLMALTRAVALEFAEFGVRCNAVLPGAVATEGAGAHKASGYVTRGPMMGEGRIPLARMATPQDIAHAVLYLAAPASAYVTGHGLLVDGGFMVS